MQKLIRSGSVRMYLYIGSVLIIAGVWRAGEAVNASFSKLAVKEVPRVAQPPVLDTKALYPVWVKQAAANGFARGDASQSDVEGLFRGKPGTEESPARLPETRAPTPDYAGRFKQEASIDGVSNDGVFLNGRFYRVGEPISDMQLGVEGTAAVVPVVESIKEGRVVFRIGAAHVTFVLGR